MNFFTWILIGGLLGWAASMVGETRNWRVILLNVVIGSSSVMLGGWLLGGLSGTSAFNPAEFDLGGLLVSLLGATVLLAAVQLLAASGGRRVSPRRYPPSADSESSRSWKSHQREIAAMNRPIRVRRALHPVVMAAFAAMLFFS